MFVLLCTVAHKSFLHKNPLSRNFSLHYWDNSQDQFDFWEVGSRWYINRRHLTIIHGTRSSALDRGSSPRDKHVTFQNKQTDEITLYSSKWKTLEYNVILLSWSATQCRAQNSHVESLRGKRIRIPGASAPFRGKSPSQDLPYESFVTRRSKG